MATSEVEAPVVEQLQEEIAHIPPEHLRNLLQIVRAFRESVNRSSRPVLTAKMLLNSSVAGAWRDREDIVDSAAYARALREQAQHRRREL